MKEAGYVALLGRTDLAGVYHLPRADRDIIVRAAETNGYAVFPINLRRAATREDLLDAIARDMAFPEWFGHNYDALYDCLCDLGWRPAQGYLMLLDHCDSALAGAGSDFAATLAIIREATEEWRGQGLCLWCLVDLGADSINGLPALMDGP
ncbi:MAG: hypothetical protein EKK46_07445 [Rhodocyclaceae bacterium]|nr:MAG: hypothetical protein EKK46_07445 [Rhodocyclaceae bacterium]